MIDFPQPELVGPEQGILVRGARTGRTTGEFGIYKQDGAPISHSDIVCGEYTTEYATDAPQPAGVETIPGPCLFAGVATAQFGHVLINALGRLWALDQLPPETTLIFSTKGRAIAARFPYIRTILDSLGIKNPYRIVTDPTRFDMIYTATDQFGERYGARGSSFFYSWLDARLPEPEAKNSAQKLYVSRSGLGARSGRFACEAALETQLAAHGYEIYRPEVHSLRDQFRRYRSATKIIFAEGSALHAFALLRSPNQDVAVIQRRQDLPPLIQNQMNDLEGTPVLAIDAIRSVYWHPVRADHLSVSLLDFEILGKRLLDGGFLETLTSWDAPTQAAEDASLTAGLSEDEKMHDFGERQAFLREIRRQRRARAAGAV